MSQTFVLTSVDKLNEEKEIIWIGTTSAATAKLGAELAIDLIDRAKEVNFKKVKTTYCPSLAD